MDRSKVKRVLFGEPFPNSMAIHERLDKVRGLAVFASDPISSNAYATEAVMSILIVLGTGALKGMTMPIVMAIAALVLIVIFSYIQTILHYPKGGGSYIVSKDNLWHAAFVDRGGGFVDRLFANRFSIGFGGYSCHRLRFPRSL
jgi:hypothetical protein